MTEENNNTTEQETPAPENETPPAEKEKVPETPLKYDMTTPQPVGLMALNPNYFLFLLLIAALIGCYAVIKPYLNIIILAGIFATIFRPVYKKILQLCKHRENIAAFCSCLVITLVVVIPLTIMLFSLIQQGVQSFNSIYAWIEAGEYKKIMAHPFVTGIYTRIQDYLPDVQKLLPNLDVKNFEIDKIALNTSKVIGKTLLDQGGHIAGNMSSLIGKFFLFLFAFYFFVRDEDKIIKYMLHLMPLKASQEEKILSKIKAVSKSALLGTLVTAVAQGAAGGIAFWVAGLPALFWGMMMAFASLIPLVGTALIWVPAAVYLIITGKWIMGVGMVIWCVVVVGSIDNFVRPIFMQGSADMSTLLIFFSILGGINCFGLIGLLYGPLIFGLTIVLLYIYSVEFEQFLNGQDQG